MNNLRRLSVVGALALALTVPAFAGQIETTIAPPPPQPTQTATREGNIQTSVAGQIDTGSSEATAVDSATEIALNFIQSVLSLF